MVLMWICFLIGITFFGLRYVYSYWSRKGFPFIPPSIPFGNLEDVAKNKKSFGMGIYDLYKATTEPFIGIYLFFRPAILINDPDLIKNILTNDFSYFHDRGIYCNEKNDPLSASVFALSGSKWKNLRSKLTPTFTSGKLKSMFTTVTDVAKELTDYLEPFAKEKQVIEMKELISRYTLDNIASVIFGLEMNSIKNPEDEFRQLARSVNTPTFIQSLRVAGTFICPKLIEFLRIHGVDEDVKKFMINIVKKTIDHREQNNVSRKDFMQLLLQLRNTGVVQQDGDWDVQTSAETKLLSIEQCAAQVFIFFIAGTESSASTISYCLYELTQNPDLMVKIQEDIDSTLKKYNGEITYESLMEMKFLEACINETLRKYPALPILNRECTKDYQIPGSNFKIEKGMGIIISLLGVHMDPKHFPEPEKFIPQRFLDEVKTYNEKVYLPFGDGPRNCIAFRLGLLIVKVGLVQLLTKYNFNTLQEKKIEFDIGSVGLVAKGGINLTVSKRDV